jgi:hypothetical protein
MEENVVDIEVVSPRVTRRSVVVKNERRLVVFTFIVWVLLICILEWAWIRSFLRIV